MASAPRHPLLGDIDTHGFAMLGQLRSHLPRARSLLMDSQTLVERWQHRSVEDNPFIASLERLTLSEKALYDDLRYDRLGRRVRLEQERMAFGWLERALADVLSSRDRSSALILAAGDQTASKGSGVSRASLSC